MTSAICFNLDQSKILSSGNELNIKGQCIEQITIMLFLTQLFFFYDLLYLDTFPVYLGMYPDIYKPYDG